MKAFLNVDVFKREEIRPPAETHEEFSDTKRRPAVPRAALLPDRLPSDLLCLAVFSCKFRFPIQAPILNCLADVGRAELRRPSEVRDGPGNLEHPVVRPR
jgi:hypothetical protein